MKVVGEFSSRASSRRFSRDENSPRQVERFQCGDAREVGMTSAERPTSSPVSLKFGLLVVGAAAALSTHFAWRAKATNAFKASYATTWLTLGTATILYVQPDREELERKLRASASARESLAPVSAEAREAQIRALKGAAEPDGARSEGRR
jgi:hypothetical protein